MAGRNQSEDLNNTGVGRKPAYMKPTIHRMNRSASFHDYTAPSLFLLTFTAHEGRPTLCSVSFTTDKGHTDIIHTLTELGERFKEEIEAIVRFHPEMELYRYVIMPDHLHIIINVKTKLKRKLGEELSGFITACNKHYRSLANIKGDKEDEAKYFTVRFNDRIIMRRGQLEIAKNYIKDNPRRLLIKRANPDLFSKYLHLRIGEREYTAFGNIFLLKDFNIKAVAVHRAWLASELEMHEREWLQTAKSGGVLVSPFISRAEKEIRKKAIEAGGRIIQLRSEGLEKRFKPSGKDFDLCAEGRLLILAPWSENLRKDNMTRSKALQLNAMADEIAALNPEIRISIVKERTGK